MNIPRCALGSTRFGLSLVAVSALLLACFGALSSSVRGGPAERLVIIATGPVAGMSYVAGGAVCRSVNGERSRHGLRCLVESGDGSAENLLRLRRGEIQFAIVQSDWLHVARDDGIGPEPEPFEELRAVMPLHAQVVTVVASPQSGIRRLEDLKGRRVGLGPDGSGIRAASEALFGALGWRESDFEELSSLGIEAQVEALCGGDLDAFVLPVVHPNGVVAAAAACGATLIEVTGPAVERLLAEWPFYTPAQIPGGLYPGDAEAIASYGTRATLVTTSDMTESAVYDMVSAVLGDLPAFTARHPALSGLDVAQMARANHGAPTHAGARRAYRERGKE